MSRLMVMGAIIFVSPGMVGRTSEAANKPDLEYGAYLASECRGCHRPQAAAGAVIPDLAGMAETTFVTVMKAYREKRLPNPVMQNIAGRFSDDDLAALAAYFASQHTPAKIKP